MTPLQIETIKKFGRKELMAGCIFKYWDYYSFYCHPWTSFHIVQKLNADTYAIWNEDFRKIEILWHLPHLEDIFRVAKDKDFDLFQVVYHDKMWSTESQQGIFVIDNMGKSVRITYNSTLPLIEQDESILSQLLSLFK